MTELEFDQLRRLLRRLSGLALGPDKRYLVESRLRPVWQEAGFASLGELVRRLLAGERGPLSQAVADAMCIHETFFFRDAAVFDALRTVVVPRLVEARRAQRRLRVWSAAASTGQEAYSLAMLLADTCPALADWHVTILATDLSAAAVARIREGTYSQAEVQRGLPIRSLLRHFSQGPEGWTVEPALRRVVQARRFNLLDDLGPLGSFDLVLCRNLLIYLDETTKARLLARLAAALARDGVLCLGSSETLLGRTPDLAAHPEARGFSVPARSMPRLAAAS